MEQIGERLKQLRKENKIMQKDIAASLGLPLRTYQSYEYGEVEPSAAIMRKLADMFGVTAGYIMGSGEESGLIITPRIRAVLDDRRLSLEAKGLYMQLQMYSVNDKTALVDESRLLEETGASQDELRRIAGELERFGYAKAVDVPEIKVSTRAYGLAGDYGKLKF